MSVKRAKALTMLMVVGAVLMFLVLALTPAGYMNEETQFSAEASGYFPNVEIDALRTVTKVGDAAYILTNDFGHNGSEVSTQETIVRLDLLNGNVDHFSLNITDMDVSNPYQGSIMGLLEGDGGLYAYGWIWDQDVDPATIRFIMWDLDIDSMELGEPWSVPDLDNELLCDLFIEDGMLYKMPGFASKYDEGLSGAYFVPSPTIKIVDLKERELISTINVTEDLCSSNMFPFGDVFLGYWTFDYKSVGEFFELDPDTGEIGLIGSLSEYHDYFINDLLHPEACGNVVLFPNLIDWSREPSTTVLAMDDSYDVTKTDLTFVPEENGFIMSTGDEGGVLILQFWMDDQMDQIQTYTITYEEGRDGPLFAAYLIPLAILCLGMFIQLNKKWK
ncbi:MAG: hypothetical protein E4H30_07800 [Methanomassiliicoccus sp.]|nr:MAG: hypothetical protein E4H30_07800 [Methanomassiliicoccus sp.]